MGYTSRSNGCIFVCAVSFYKGWDIDLMVASLCLLCHFTGMGHTSRSNGCVFVFAVSFYKC